MDVFKDLIKLMWVYRFFEPEWFYINLNWILASI